VPRKKKTLYADEEISVLFIRAIDQAKNEVIIISPYVTLWNNLTRAIKRARQNGVTFKLYYRDDYSGKLEGATIELFDEIYAVPNLHAKIYLFDGEAIISSMNLLGSSQKDSMEIAIRLTDKQEINELRAYITKRIIPAITQSKGQKGTTRGPSQTSRTTPQKQQNEYTAHCIRCGSSIQFDLEFPHCKDCFEEWNQYQNPTYIENFCHRCGKEYETTIFKPECPPCWTRGQRSNS